MGTWSGAVLANQQTPTSTGITVEEGDTIAITATGFVSKDNGNSWNGPGGLYNNKTSSHVDPSANGAALLLVLGGTYYAYDDIALSPLVAPTSGAVTLVVNDTPGKYGDNKGSFNVDVKAQAPEQTQQFTDVFELYLQLTLVNGAVVQQFSTDNQRFFPLKNKAIIDVFDQSGTLTVQVSSQQDGYNALAQSVELVTDNAPTPNGSLRWTPGSGSGEQATVTLSLTIPDEGNKNQYDIAVGLQQEGADPIWADPIAIIRRV